MGKKHRLKQNEKVNKSKTGLVSQLKKQVLIDVEKIFAKCIKNINPLEEWDFYLQLYEDVEELRKKQNAVSAELGHKSRFLDRASCLPAFMDWLKTTGITYKNLEIYNYGNKHEFGLRATSQIEADELLVTVPRSAMITQDDYCFGSYIKDFIENNQILSQMPNICLALFVHCELYNPKSRFKPYFDFFPHEFNTSLYFTPDEMKYLKGSPVLSAAVNHFQSIARQFCLVYKLFHSPTGRSRYADNINSEAREKFTFDSYRWCVSAVSTRQNHIPLKRFGKLEMTEEVTLALIPFWDLFNHHSGPLSTQFDVSIDSVTSYAMKDFNEGEQVTICYGERKNADLLIHNGFVMENNPVEKELSINFGVSHQDPLGPLKICLLRRFGVEGNDMFSISPIYPHLPASKHLLSFLRVFHMNSEQLSMWLTKRDDQLRVIVDTVPSAHSIFENDMQISQYLEARLNLHQMSRNRSCGGDPFKLLQDDSLSPRARLALTIQKEECLLLQLCADQCQHFRLSLDSLVISEIDETHTE